MKRALVALVAPPAAVVGHGSASYTAAPIAVFWLTSLFSIGHGLTGGKLGNLEGSQWVIVGIGILLWIISAAWARLVISGVQADIEQTPDSPVQHRVPPDTDEEDPFSQIGGTR
jgi:hypothetical protein